MGSSQETMPWEPKEAAIPAVDLTSSDEEGVPDNGFHYPRGGFQPPAIMRGAIQPESMSKGLGKGTEGQKHEKRAEPKSSKGAGKGTASQSSKGSLPGCVPPKGWIDPEAPPPMLRHGDLVPENYVQDSLEGTVYRAELKKLSAETHAVALERVAKMVKTTRSTPPEETMPEEVD